MKKLLLLLSALCSPVLAQQPNWITGVYTVAPGPDNITTNLPPVAYQYYIAWVVDRPGGAGFMVSNGTDWVSDQGPPGTNGTNGSSVLSGTGVPSSGLGANGDFYVDVTVYRMYGPKTSGIWGTGASLIGPQGNTGSTGSAGMNGAAATIAVGTTTTLSPGASATVANAGTSSAAVFNFGIPAGVAGANAFGSPNSRSLSLATAYQATNTAKPAVVTVNLSSTASLSLSGGTTNTGEVVIGSTNAVASGTGTSICRYSNTNTGALTIGLALSTTAGSTCTFALPTGWFFAVRTSAGTVSVTSAFDQSVG